MARSSVHVGLLMLLCLSPKATASEELTVAQRASLQATMFQHIDRETFKGSFLYLNVSDGTVESFSPVKAHPMIVRLGDYFVLCTDFRRENGANVNVDFYLARKDPGFEVFHTEVDNRKPLEQLINRGKASFAE